MSLYARLWLFPTRRNVTWPDNRPRGRRRIALVEAPHDQRTNGDVGFDEGYAPNYAQRCGGL